MTQETWSQRSTCLYSEYCLPDCSYVRSYIFYKWFFNFLNQLWKMITSCPSNMSSPCLVIEKAGPYLSRNTALPSALSSAVAQSPASSQRNWSNTQLPVFLGTLPPFPFQGWTSNSRNHADRDSCPKEWQRSMTERNWTYGVKEKL